MGATQIAIDGPVGSGKTTVALELARELGFVYLDTGAMYRAVGLAALQTGTDPANEAAVLAVARAHPPEVTLDSQAPLGFCIALDGRTLGDELYAPDVATAAAAVAQHPGVRALMVERQRAIADERPVVMAGRDIGTVVLPNATLKVFLDASVEARVERRLLQFREQGRAVDPLVLKGEIEERDRLDRSRAVGPLRRAPGALVIDSSALSVQQVVASIRAAIGQSVAS